MYASVFFCVKINVNIKATDAYYVMYLFEYFNSYIIKGECTMLMNQEEIYNQPQPRVGYAFVKPQGFAEPYAPMQGLERGTVFSALDIQMEKYGMQYDDLERNE